MADTASFSAAMKTKFIGPIRDNLHRGKVLLFGDADANPENFRGIIPTAEGIDFVGNDFRIPLKTGRNASVGFRAENAVLPAPGKSSYTYLTEPMRYAYALFNITGQLMKAAESTEGAFVSAFKQEMDDTVLSSKLDHNRAAYGDGSGKMCDVSTTAAAATVIPVSSTINFRGGEVIDFTTAGGTVVSAAHTVQLVDRVAKTITITPGLAGGITAGTHFPVRASSDSTIATPNNSLNAEIQGLGSIVSDTGTLHGVNPATYGSLWKSYKKTAIGAISDAVLRDAKDGVMFESGLDLEDSALDFAIVTTRGIRRRYADTLISVKQFTDAQSVKLHGGFKVLMFDENPIFVDDQCPVGQVFGLSLRKMFWAQMSDWDWMDEDGKILKWDTTRRDRYLAVLYKYSQLGTTARNAHFNLQGVNDDNR